MSKDKPLTEEELRQRIATAEIVFAKNDEIVALENPVRVILAVLRDFGFGSAMVTDESCFSDFGLDADELRQIGERIGCKLDPECEDDWWIARVAARMKREQQS